MTPTHKRLFVIVKENRPFCGVCEKCGIHVSEAPGIVTMR